MKCATETFRYEMWDMKSIEYEMWDRKNLSYEMWDTKMCDMNCGIEKIRIWNVEYEIYV